MNRRGQGFLLAAAAALALALGLAAGRGPARLDTSPTVDAEAVWNATFPDLSGRPVALRQWRGQVVVLNFWATWCPPCRAEMPEFVKIQERYQGRGFTFVGIALDQPEAVAAFAKQLAINYPLLVGGVAGADFARALGSRGALPFSVVLDRDGRIVASHLGTLSEAELLRLLPLR